MLMMKIEMNADKIQAEQRYTMSAINRTIAARKICCCIIAVNSR